MNKVLENKYPYLMNFFHTAISEKRLFHSIILHGSNNYLQYAISLELARQLNCLNNGEDNCDCRNCRWIRENKHPAVMTISKIDNKTDSSKTVISEEQINALLDTLVNSSDYHRVFIFCDADMKQPKPDEKLEYDEFKSTGFNPSLNEIEGKIWYPSGINSSCFSTVAANAMLKSIEEPSSNVTFIFLTNNKDDLIQTIVSRSQSFNVPYNKTLSYDICFLRKYFESYPKFNKDMALDFSQMLYNVQIENSFDAKYIIDSIQYYLIELLKINASNDIVRSIIYKDIEKTEQSKKMLDAYIKEQSVYEELAFYFAKR